MFLSPNFCSSFFFFLNRMRFVNHFGLFILFFTDNKIKCWELCHFLFLYMLCHLWTKTIKMEIWSMFLKSRNKKKIPINMKSEMFLKTKCICFLKINQNLNKGTLRLQFYSVPESIYCFPLHPFQLFPFMLLEVFIAIHNILQI